MKYSLVTTCIILSLFLLTQFIGLYVNNVFFEKNLPYGLQPPKVKPKQSPWFFVSMIITASILFFLMKRFNLEALLKIWFFIAFTICLAITLSAFMSPWIAIFVAASLIILKIKEKDLFVHNLTEILTYGGIVAIFVPMLNLLYATIVLIIISIYDFIAVNITKHMIGLAKMQEKLGIFSGLIVINKDDVAILGGGDLAFSLLFATVVLRDVGVVNALLTVYGTAIAILILTSIGKRKKFYPAMPFITAGALLGFLISLFV